MGWVDSWIGLGWVRWRFFSFCWGWVGLGWVSQQMGLVGSGQTKWTRGQLCQVRTPNGTSSDSVISAGITVIITYRQTHFMVIEITQHIEYITQCSWYISKPHFHDMPAMRPDNKALIASAVVIQHRGNFR